MTPTVATFQYFLSAGFHRCLRGVLGGGLLLAASTGQAASLDMVLPGVPDIDLTYAVGADTFAASEIVFASDNNGFVAEEAIVGGTLHFDAMMEPPGLLASGSLNSGETDPSFGYTSFGFWDDRSGMTPTPIPPAVWLCGLAIVGLVAFSRARKRDGTTAARHGEQSASTFANTGAD